LQKVNRDTLRFAMKASAAEIDGEWRDVYKDPVTDQGKRSKAGRLALIHDDGDGYRTVRERDRGDRPNALVTVYRNGELLVGLRRGKPNLPPASIKEMPTCSRFDTSKPTRTPT